MKMLIITQHVLVTGTMRTKKDGITYVALCYPPLVEIAANDELKVVASTSACEDLQRSLDSFTAKLRIPLMWFYLRASNTSLLPDELQALSDRAESAGIGINVLDEDAFAVRKAKMSAKLLFQSSVEIEEACEAAKGLQAPWEDLTAQLGPLEVYQNDVYTKGTVSAVSGFLTRLRADDCDGFVRTQMATAGGIAVLMERVMYNRFVAS